LIFVISILIRLISDIIDNLIKEISKIFIHIDIYR